MTSNSPVPDRSLKREIVVVIVLTALGALVRLWSVGRLGLVHFDEGIYALAGLWIYSPGGLAGIDPASISYAPPGFPLLIGLFYMFLGIGDVAAILASIASGILTIPVVAWLSRRTFGPGAGAAAAGLAAFSGPLVAFSRMALTDASFLLVWLCALGQGQRFVERPNLFRAVLLGLAVGISQLYKYNGWTSGIIVALSSAVWLFANRRASSDRRAAAIWGWGLVAVIVAAAVYWPWFQFVDSHGGYRALLAHQRSYVGGLSSWPWHFSHQLAQATALCGGPAWLACSGLAAAFGISISIGDFGADHRLLAKVLPQALALTALCVITGLSWWVALASAGCVLLGKNGLGNKSVCLVCVGWAAMSALTPIYHPYSRLWLPLEALGWLLFGGLFVEIRSRVDDWRRGARWTGNYASNPLSWFVLASLIGAIFSAYSSGSPWRLRHLGLLAPSDSLRLASRSILGELPKDLSHLRVLARPSLTFYLAQANGVAIGRQPDLTRLFDSRDPRAWAILDMALMRQDNISEVDLERSLGDWLVVREIPTTLNLPTLLDIDPAAARAGQADSSAPIRLLRPRRRENVR
jgi:dolichyl-phosphate-mannose-protein mannosyltransferase